MTDIKLCEGQPECPGDHGVKLPGCVSEALWDTSMTGMCESTGSTEWRHHVVIATFDDGDNAVTIGGEADGEGAWTVVVPPGTYLLYTDDRGTVCWTRHDRESDAKIIFDAVDAEYGTWLHGCDDPDCQRDDDHAALPIPF